MDSADVSPAQWAPGKRIAGRYVCEGVLGEGGMGVVVSAVDELLGRRVAIKVAHPEISKDPVCRERILREARAAAKLRSVHTARVIDVGTTADDLPLIVFEYLDGRDLLSLLREHGPLSPEMAVDYVLQACDALREAHALGIVHRDIKPENLFLATNTYGEQTIKLLDFGISKVTREEAALQLTSPEYRLGTPNYMSPEQLRGVSVDWRSDVWALGAVLYELLTGQQAFEGEYVDILSSILNAEPRAVREIRAGVPAALETVISRCLSKSPGGRYSSIDELMLALAPFAPAQTLPDVSEIAVLLPHTCTAGRARRRRRMAVAGIAAALAASAMTLASDRGLTTVAAVDRVSPREARWLSADSGRASATVAPRRTDKTASSFAAVDPTTSPRDPALSPAPEPSARTFTETPRRVTTQTKKRSLARSLPRWKASAVSDPLDTRNFGGRY